MDYGALAPAAHARPATEAQWHSSPAPTRATPQQAPIPDVLNAGHAPAGVTPVVRVVEQGAGFDWSDAGIGAAGGLGVALLAGGLTVASDRRRGTRHARAIVPTSGR